MTWYNPLSWFAPSPPSSSQPIELYCANPQCRQPLSSRKKISYEPTHQTVMHGGECRLMYLGHLALESGGAVIATFDTLSSQKAQALARQGKIARICLEGKINP